MFGDQPTSTTKLLQYDLHIIPSGIVHPTALNLVGSGTVVSVPQFFKELETLRGKGINSDGRVFVSDRAHLLFELRMSIERVKEVY